MGAAHGVSLLQSSLRFPALIALAASVIIILIVCWYIWLRLDLGDDGPLS
jgi:hypothetical protein